MKLSRLCFLILWIVLAFWFVLHLFTICTLIYFLIIDNFRLNTRAIGFVFGTATLFVIDRMVLGGFSEWVCDYLVKIER